LATVPAANTPLKQGVNEKLRDHAGCILAERPKHSDGGLEASVARREAVQIAHDD